MSEQDEETTKNNSPDRKRFSKKKLCFLLIPVLAILMAILFFAFNEYRTPDFNVLLTRTKLAKLPESVKNLKVDTRPVMSRGRVVPDFYSLLLKFQAEPNDIHDFRFFRVMSRSICDPKDREKSFGALYVQITPLVALICPSAQTIFLSTQSHDPDLFGAPTH